MPRLIGSFAGDFDDGVVLSASESNIVKLTVINNAVRWSRLRRRPPRSNAFLIFDRDSCRPSAGMGAIPRTARASAELSSSKTSSAAG